MRLPTRCTLIAVVLGAAAYSGCGSSAPACVDRTAANADRNIYFGGLNGSGAAAYLPQCMIISAGQTVTFQGAFNMHPLAKGAPSDVNAGSPNSPLPDPAHGTGSAPFDVTFPTAGNYPYWCTIHYAEGMTGQVQVK
jgi:plastocyanin